MSLVIFSCCNLYVWLTSAQTFSKQGWITWWVMGQDLLSSGISKNGRKIWKWECGSTQWKVKYMVYERNMKITIWACWFQNKMIALYSSLFIRSCAFKIWYCRKQAMYCFFPFGFINVIISAFNPCDPDSRFVGAESCKKVCFRSFGSIHTNL